MPAFMLQTQGRWHERDRAEKLAQAPQVLRLGRRGRRPSAEEARAIKRVWGETLGTDALKVNPPPGLDEFNLRPPRHVGYRPCRHSGDMHDAGTSSREAS